MSRGFRVWDMVSERYLPVSRGGNDGVLGITTDGTGIIYVEDGEVNSHLAGASSVIIEQYTGLKDKNGKKIYEGDIVELDWYIYGDKPAYRVKSKVIFDEEGARVCNGKHSDLLKYCTGIEAIGNIHENPELLGGEE